MSGIVLPLIQPPPCDCSVLLFVYFVCLFFFLSSVVLMPREGSIQTKEFRNIGTR